MKSRHQALKLCLDAAVVVVVKIVNEFTLKVVQRPKFLQVKEFAFEQDKEILYHSIVQTVTLSTHALPDILVFEHGLVASALV